RARFINSGGLPVQIIENEVAVKLPVVDLTSYKPHQRNEEMDKIIVKDIHKPIDLTQGPLLRVILSKLEHEVHFLLVIVHHIAYDAFSEKIFLREIKIFYESYLNNSDSPLDKLPIQYSDYARWQRQKLSGSELTKHVSYWREQLRDCPPTLNLPKFSSEKNDTRRGAQVSVELPQSLTDDLKGLSQRLGVTLFMVLLAAFFILLKRYTAQEDIVIGSPVAGRTNLDTEKLIGVFINTLILRADLSGDPTFNTFLGDVRQTLIDALAHQELPFEKLVEELQPERNQHSSPFFQVMFNFKNIPENINSSQSLQLKEVHIDPGIALFDLNLEVINNDGIFTCLFKYNADQFCPELIERMLNNFQVLLQGITNKCESKISELPLLAESEVHLQLVTWDDVDNPYPYTRTYPELFELQAQNTPENTAVIHGDRSVTYRELNTNAELFASYLRYKGVRSGEMIGLCFDKSPEMVIGILGIWKAGGTCVPLDPNYPKDRLGFMIEDAKIRLLVTKNALSEELPDFAGDIIYMDRDWSKIEQHVKHSPTNHAMADNVAYVIYTSGSTGNPKGVMIAHSAFANYCQVMKDYWLVDSSDSILQLASLSFDLSLTEIFVNLTCGAKIVLPTGDYLVPQQLTSNLSRHKITRFNLSPAMWRQWLQSLIDDQESSDLSELRLVGVGSDVVPPEVVLLWNSLELSKRVKLVNAYGPTEVTITTTVNWTVLENFSTTVPIGRPLPGCPHYILDQDRQPVPIGVAGELYIGGRRLALGYLNRPNLTAEVFVPDPFSDEVGAKMYKTGDLARYLPDGTIDFLGRVDHQVKIRGFRVELGEIEAVLNRHPEVAESVAVAIQVKPEEKSLVAYVIPKITANLNASGLRQYLKKSLPEYMIPSNFVFIDEFPLSPNGKVDRKWLPCPDISTSTNGSEFVAPRNLVEQKLATIWQEVLNRDEISIHDNFFTLGGHSLNAKQVISRVHDQFIIELPLVSIFDAESLASLATMINEETGSNPTDANRFQ
ncbi:MAG: amino acid adenylation domain-containing protein, partial [Gammaproteobacteria bacterium]